MHRIEVTYKTVSPVILVTQTPDQNTVSTLDYFPGSSILGGFARLYEQQSQCLTNLETDTRFREWFLSDSFRFSDAHYVVTRGDKNYPTLPAPMSLQTTKEKKVFFHPEMTELELKENNTKPIQQNIHIDRENRYHLESPKKQSVFHHHRDDYRSGHGGENSIFHYQALSPGQTFIGYLSGEKDLLERFVSMMRECDQLLLGRSKGTQYGRVTFHFGSMEPIPPLVEDWDALDFERIDIRFISPVLLRNEHGCFSSDASLVENALGDGIEICRAYARTRRLEHFVGVWRMKRPSALAIDKGSSYRIKTSLKTRKEQEEWLRKLQEGIGERRNEGFGQVDIIIGGDRSEWQKKNLHEPDIRKPSQPLTEKALLILKGILEEHLKQGVSKKAMEDSSQVPSTRIPSLHLLSRLLNMIDQASSFQVFQNMMDNLKKKARDALERCIIHGVSLLHMIENYTLTKEELYQPIPRQLYNEYAELADSDVDERWQILYWRELIRYLRIRKKQSEQGGERA